MVLPSEASWRAAVAARLISLLVYSVPSPRMSMGAALRVQIGFTIAVATARFVENFCHVVEK